MALRGRHRKNQPSRINRASLTVTAGGAGIALPLVGAGAAQAASLDVWEKVAACESSSNWSINTGNGYFGGLQFSQSTWERYGGTHYAPRADLASKDQQIAVAEKVLKGQGPEAWPTCSPRAGLAQQGNTGLKPASLPRQRPVATQTPATRATPTTVPQVREMYTVTPGDSLSRIAREERVKGGWQRLYEANRKVVGDDPDLILPGQKLTLRITAPSATKPSTTKPSKTEPSKSASSKAVPKTKPPAAKPPAAKPPAAKPPAAKPPAAKAPTAKPPAPKPPVTKTKPVSKPATTKPAPKPAPKPETRSDSFSAPVSASIGTRYRVSGSSWSSGYHTGVDFPVPTGTSVKAVAPGRVVSAGWAGAYGYQIVIRHDDGRYSQYAHLSALTVRDGQRVNGGQRIARSGSTGNSSGPHLHFEMRTGPGYGSDVDPLAYLRARGVSI
ncbi:transglycosylase family protein [Streptomyces sp. P9(2023)]|uniref:transglycosylase family protein n=1 Tax=Streptomyces sp. P9(2023) TaxID=3064394 RepID=UPI0028F45084|nr:transglycosylase family protein [Streptomyces sp. P9(2023)]MDT9693005.1 transglycosylase family protein [Streptomyces sp. P9(2023)]